MTNVTRLSRVIIRQVRCRRRVESAQVVRISADNDVNVDAEGARARRTFPVRVARRYIGNMLILRDAHRPVRVRIRVCASRWQGGRSVRVPRNCGAGCFTAMKARKSRVTMRARKL